MSEAPEGVGERNCSMNFTHETLGQRVVFGTGNGAQNLASELARLGGSRPMVLATEGELRRSRHILNDIKSVLVHTEVRQHVPADVADRAHQAALRVRADVLVSIGGGSATGTAKAIALQTGLPIVAVPTTYAGSEATNVWGLTRDGEKTTGVDDRVLPRTVIYDAALTLGMPKDLSVASALNAMAHCIDSLWAPHANPITTALAGEGIRVLAPGLETIAGDPADRAGREQLLYGTYLAAVAFTGAGSGMHHKICHVLGGRFGLPHAETHAAVLPHVLAFNAPAAPEAAARVGDSLRVTDPISAFTQLYEETRAPQALRDFGLNESDIEEAATLILPKIPDSNPRPVSHQDLAHLLRAAWTGDRPGYS
jgi:maleylacetate reductase